MINISVKSYDMTSVARYRTFLVTNIPAFCDVVRCHTIWVDIVQCPSFLWINDLHKLLTLSKEKHHAFHYDLLNDFTTSTNSSMMTSSTKRQYSLDFPRRRH